MLQPARVAPESDAIFEEECRHLVERITVQRERATRLRELADYLDDHAARDEHLLGELRAALGADSQLRLEDLDVRLKGRRLRDVALEILEREVGPGRPIHYKDWYRLLRSAGFEVSGRNPVATFLTQVQRAPQIERLGNRSGIYQIAACRASDRHRTAASTPT